MCQGAVKAYFDPINIYINTMPKINFNLFCDFPFCKER